MEHWDQSSRLFHQWRRRFPPPNLQGKHLSYHPQFFNLNNTNNENYDGHFEDNNTYNVEARGNYGIDVAAVIVVVIVGDDDDGDSDDRGCFNRELPCHFTRTMVCSSRLG